MYVSVCAYVCLLTYVSVCTLTYLCVCMLTYVCVCTCIYMYCVYLTLPTIFITVVLVGTSKSYAVTFSLRIDILKRKCSTYLNISYGKGACCKSSVS